MAGPRLVEVGVISRPHGVRGELRVVLHDPTSATLGQVEVVAVGGEVFRVERARAAGGAYLIKVAGIDDRDAAEAVRGMAVAVRRDDIEVGEGEVLLVDLVGCEARLADGEVFGEVVDIVAGLQDRLVIRDRDVVRELPFVPELVIDVDLEARVIVVDPPEDLPEEPVEQP